MNKNETAGKARLARHNNRVCVWWVNIIGVEAWTGIFFPHTLFMAPMDICYGGGCASC